MLDVLQRAELRLQDAADAVASTRSAPRCRRSSSAGRGPALGPKRSSVQIPSRAKARPGRYFERLAQQFAEQVHAGAVVAQDVGERVVLLAGPLGPQHVVEEQVPGIRRREPVEFGAGTVHDHFAQRTDSESRPTVRPHEQ